MSKISFMFGTLQNKQFHSLLNCFHWAWTKHPFSPAHLELASNSNIYCLQVSGVLCFCFSHKQHQKDNRSRCFFTLAHASMWCCSIGTPATGNKGLGTSNDSGLNLVPAKPEQGLSAQVLQRKTLFKNKQQTTTAAWTNTRVRLRARNSYSGVLFTTIEHFGK